MSNRLDATQRLERLEAIEAARTALARYADVCDAQDLDAVIDVFTPDGAVDAGGRLWRGRGEIAAFFQDAWAVDPSRKRHFITNIETSWVEGRLVSVKARLLYTTSGLVLGWGTYDGLVCVHEDRARFEQLGIAVEATVVLDGGAP